MADLFLLSAIINEEGIEILDFVGEFLLLLLSIDPVEKANT